MHVGAAQGLSEPLSICVASCSHNVDEWVHCPAARLSPPSSIRTGNWVLIECNGDGRKKKTKKQHKQIKAQGRHLLTFNIFNIPASNCQRPWWLWTKPSFNTFCLFTLWFPSLFRSIVNVLCWMLPPRFRFSFKIAFIAYCSQCQQLICVFLFFFHSLI